MEDLNNFNIISGIQNYTTLLKSKDIFLPLNHLKPVRCAFTVILCVALDIEMKSSRTKQSYLLDHIKKADH